MGYIYKITNTLNGKSYIGQTTRKPESRFAEHLKYHKNTLIMEDVQKHGIDAFTVEILHECFDFMLRDLETEEIKNHNAYKPNGYNRKSKGITHTAEHRRKNSEAKKGKKHQHGWKISEAHKRSGLKPPSAKGKKQSPEHIRKRFEARTRNNKHRHSEYEPCRQLFLALPADMPLDQKRKLLYRKFPNRSYKLIWAWVKEWTA